MIVPTELETKIGFYDKSKVKGWLMADKARKVEKEKEKAGLEAKKEAKAE
jgi:hypothetical protein